ncbi:MAG: RnfH family protein [Pseudomonadota bacterium]|nr:RnfH family protein [Pseudomonadota bacterium]
MAQPDSETLTVEVAFASPDREVILALAVPPGTTVIEAIHRSGILQRISEIDLAQNKIGIFGKLVSPDHVLHQYDRVEIYRPLVADPKEIRRLRANKPRQKAK